MPSLVGNKPNQVPTNGDLGTLAFQDANAVQITGGTAVIDSLTADSVNLRVDHDITNICPSLLLDFANSKTLDPRITFSRASTATFYDGKTTAKAEENLTTFSEQFDNAYWAKTNVTATANSTTAPDGTSTADTLTASATNAGHYFEAVSTTPSAVVGVSVTHSIFAKANTASVISLTASSSGATVYSNFDLSAGTAGTTGAGCTAAITSVGNSWYRCSITFTTAHISNYRMIVSIQNATSDARLASWNAAGTESIYIWGAQVEQRSAVSAYTPTTTAPITNYIPALQTAQSGVARFEHNPITGESLGLLIEESRANLLLRSEDFSTTWTNQESTEQVNVAIAPDGTLTADKLIPSSNNDSHWIAQTVTATAVAHTFSFYAKAGEYGYVQVLNANSATERLNFDLVTGVLGSATGYTGTITAVGNGWYRCTATLTLSATSSQWARIGVITSATAARGEAFAGNGFSGIYIWGAQLEAGAFATSYIPTTSTSVTRQADAAEITGTNFSNWYNISEGTLYADWGPCRGPASTTIISSVVALTATVGVNDIVIDASSANVRTFITANSVSQAALTSSGAQGFNGGKAAIAYKTDDIALSVKGSSALTDTTAIIPSVNRLIIGNFASNPAVLNGTIKKLAYFPKRLPNAELVEMTS